MGPAYDLAWFPKTENREQRFSTSINRFQRLGSSKMVKWLWYMVPWGEKPDFFTEVRADEIYQSVSRKTKCCEVNIFLSQFENETFSFSIQNRGVAICQRPFENEAPLSSENCWSPKNAGNLPTVYTGTMSTTVSGRPCSNWLQPFLNKVHKTCENNKCEEKAWKPIIKRVPLTSTHLSLQHVTFKQICHFDT